MEAKAEFVVKEAVDYGVNELNTPGRQVTEMKRPYYAPKKCRHLLMKRIELDTPAPWAKGAEGSAYQIRSGIKYYPRVGGGLEAKPI